MDRRKSLKNLLMGSLSLVSLPTWANGWGPSDVNIPNLYVDDDQKILSSVVDTIIPQGDQIGALSVGVDKYIQRLLADCYEKEIQESFKQQLNDLNESASETFGKPFVSCNPDERKSILLAKSNAVNMLEREFFEFMKNETIRGFRTSKEVMTTYFKYKMAPGYYHGCVEIETV